MLKSLAEDFMQENIYNKYGGFEFFHKCIYGLYLSMFDHPEISYHFIGVDIIKLSLHQTQFLVRAIGGPNKYEGKPILFVHHNRNISQYEFAEIAKAFRQVFIDNGVEEQDVNTIMAFVAAHQNQVVEVKLNRIDRIMMPIYLLIQKIKNMLN